MQNQDLNQLKDILTAGTMTDVLSPELQVFCQRLNPLERQALTGQGDLELDEALAAEVKHLVTASLEYSELALAFRKPAPELASLVGVMQQARAALKKDEIIRQCLADPKVGVPGGSDEHKADFRGAARRFNEAAARLERKISQYALLEEPGVLATHCDMMLGKVITAPGEGSQAKVNPILARNRKKKKVSDAKVRQEARERELRSTELAQWEETAYLELRRAEKSGEIRTSMNAWVTLWTGVVAAQRIFSSVQLAENEEAERAQALARLAISTCEVISSVLGSAAQRAVPHQPLMLLERSTLRLMEMVRVTLGKRSSRTLASDLAELGALENGEREDLGEELALAQERLREHVDQLCGRVREEQETAEGLANESRAAAQREKGQKKHSRSSFGLYESSESRSRGRRIMFLGLVVIGCMTAGWQMWASASFKVDYQVREDLQDISAKLVGGYLVQGETGNTLVLQVSEEWLKMSRVEQDNVVGILLATYKDDELKEIFLQTELGLMVARWRQGTLRRIAPPPPPKKGKELQAGVAMAGAQKS